MRAFCSSLACGRFPIAQALLHSVAGTLQHIPRSLTPPAPAPGRLQAYALWRSENETIRVFLATLESLDTQGFAEPSGRGPPSGGHVRSEGARVSFAHGGLECPSRVGPPCPTQSSAQQGPRRRREEWRVSASWPPRCQTLRLAPTWSSEPPCSSSMAAGDDASTFDALRQRRWSRKAGPTCMPSRSRRAYMGGSLSVLARQVAHEAQSAASPYERAAWTSWPSAWGALVTLLGAAVGRPADGAAIHLHLGSPWRLALAFLARSKASPR